MQIGLVRQRYTPYGGAERFVADALAALRAEGVGLKLYTRKWPGAPGNGIEPVICDPFYIGNVWRDRGFAHAARDAWSKERPDLIQSHERIAGCDVFRAGDGVHRVWLRERARGMGIIGRIGLALNPYHRYTLRAEKLLFADPALRAVICNSALIRGQIRDLFGVPDSKLHLIYNAVDSNRFSPALRAHRAAVRARHSLPESAIVFVLVGSGYHRKGVEQAIRALAQLPPAAHLLVAGRDKNPERFIARARRQGVAQRVTFAGPIDDVAPLLGAADAFVLPTLYDPLPNACLEAMAAGLPIVTSTQCGAAELLAAHDAGIVCDALDIDALAAAMQRMLDPSTRWSMGGRARTAVSALSAPAMAAQLLALYRSLLGASANPKL